MMCQEPAKPRKSGLAKLSLCLGIFVSAVSSLALAESVPAAEEAAKPALELEIKPLKMPATVAGLNSGEYYLTVVIHNRSKEVQTVSPYLEMQILDASGQLVAPSSKRGRFGRRPRGCAVAKIKFDSIAPGKSVSRKVKIKRHMLDPKHILGWKLQESGKYTFVFKYSCNRAEFASRCTCDREAEGYQAAAWETAWEGTVEQRQVLNVGS